MPISVRATFAQEGVFFAGEKLNCTITFTNSAPAPLSSANGHHGSPLPPRPSISLQHKLQMPHDDQPQQPQHESNDNGQADAKGLGRSAASLTQSVNTMSKSDSQQESGPRAHVRSDMPQQRPGTAASRALNQTRVSSDISHIDVLPRGQTESNGKEHQLTADRELEGLEELEELEEQEQTVAAPPRSGASSPPQSPESPTPYQQQQLQEMQQRAYAQQSESHTISSPGLLGLASFVYRSASFSSLATAFGLSGGEPEPLSLNDEKKLPALPPTGHEGAEGRQALTLLPPVQIMSPDNEEEKTTKDSVQEDSSVTNGRPTESITDPDRLSRFGTPIGLGLGTQSSGHSRVATDGSTTGLNEGMIELQVTDNADAQSVIDEGEYQTPRPSMDYSTRSSMQSVRGPFQQQYYEPPTRRSSFMSNRSVYSSPRTLLGQGSKKEALLWGSVQVVGQFMVDGSFIKQQEFESLKTKTMYRPTGSSGGGAIGGGTLGTVNSSDWRDRANANRLFPVFSTPPSILFVDLQLAPGESTSYTYQIELPEDLPPSHRGKTIRFAYNLVLGVQRGSVHTPAKSVQLPFRLYNNISAMGTRPVYDLMSPVILHKDTAISGVAGQGRVSEKSIENPKLARKQFEDYVDELVRNIKPSSEGSSLTQTRELTRRESDAYKDEEAVLSHTCLEKVALLSRSTSAASYDICKNNVPVAKLSLIKTRLKLGETVHGIISFTAREIPTYQISVTLETVEAIEPNYSCRSTAQTAKLTKRVHAELHESCIDTMRTSFALCIPPTATPEFKTSTITLKWYIRVEFITGPANQPRFKMTSVDERRSQFQAVESLSTESFDCTVPIQVYPTSYETGALFPPSVSFSLA
ncbi:Rgp1-domain-containing protein [Dissophora ornata]|nr:Rgp1-domain-containing protein [Dissophora ornata]